MSEEINEYCTCNAFEGFICGVCWSQMDKQVKQNKRTISLEAYLKMQNERLSHHNWHDIEAAKDAVDALLKNNDVVVEE